MVANVACARLLGVSRFGELAIVLSTVNLFTTLVAGGLTMTATKFVAEHRDTDPHSAGKVIGLSTATSFVSGMAPMAFILPLAPWLSRVVLKASGLSSALILGGVVMFFGALNGSQIGALSGFESFKQIALGSLIRGIGTFLFVTFGALLGGIAGALLGYIATGAATFLFYQRIIRRECALRRIRISYSFDRNDLRLLWRFTLPVLLTSLSFSPALWWSNILLARASGYSEAGVFNAVFQWSMFIGFFSSAVSNTALPMLSSIRAERDVTKYKRCLAINFLMAAVPAIVMAVPVAMGARFIVALYGPAFEHGAAALVLISIASVISASNTTVGYAIWSLDATTSGVLLALLRGCTLVLASYALAGKGAVGQAGAHVIMGGVQTIVQIPFMIWLLRSKFLETMSTV
jgi:O-antigen/teichoic acid export membrane protein